MKNEKDSLIPSSTYHLDIPAKKLAARGLVLAENLREEVYFNVGHTKFVKSISFTPDGRQCLSGSFDCTVKRWNLFTGECLQSFNVGPSPVRSIAFTPDGRLALSGSSIFTLKLWSLRTGECLRTITENSERDLTVVAISHNGQQCLTGFDDGSLKSWNLDTGECLHTFDGHKHPVTSIITMQNGQQCLSGSSDSLLKLWDLEKGECLRTIKGHKNARSVYYSPFERNSIAITPDGCQCLSGSRVETLNQINLWDLRTGKCLRTIKGPKAGVAVAITPDGRRALLGGSDLTLWDLLTGNCIMVFKGAYRIASVAISPDGIQCLSGSTDGELKLWNLKTGECLQTLQRYSGGVTSIALHPDGLQCLSACEKTLNLWNLGTVECVKTFGENTRISSITISPNGRYCLASIGNGISIWDLPTGKYLREIITGVSYITDIIPITPNSHQCLAIDKDGLLNLWDLRTGKCVRTITIYEHSYDIKEVAITPDGHGALVVGPGLKLWDLLTGRCVRVFEGTSHISLVAISPDGTQCLSVDYSGSFRLWDLQTGECLRTFPGNGIYPESLLITPDGYHALSQNDNGFHCWNLKTGECLHFEGHTCGNLSITPDGRYVLSKNNDGTIRIWDVASGKQRLLLMAFDDGEWLALTPKGYYHASEGGEKYLRVRIGNRVERIEKYRHKYHRPDFMTIIEKIRSQISSPKFGKRSSQFPEGFMKKDRGQAF